MGIMKLFAECERRWYGIPERDTCIIANVVEEAA